MDGRSPVVMRIALDEGNVMLGVVGDEDQIEPTSISSSFSITKHLMALCGRLEANILCTEAVVEAAVSPRREARRQPLHGQVPGGGRDRPDLRDL